LDPGLPLLAAEVKEVTDWTLYGSHVAFKLADLIYRCNQMSAGKPMMLYLHGWKVHTKSGIGIVNLLLYESR